MSHGTRASPVAPPARTHAGQGVRPDRRQIGDPAQLQRDPPVHASSLCTQSSSRAIASSIGTSRACARQHGPGIGLDLEMRRPRLLPMQRERLATQTSASRRIRRVPPGTRARGSARAIRNRRRASGPMRRRHRCRHSGAMRRRHVRRPGAGTPRRRSAADAATASAVTRGMRSPAVTWIFATGMSAPASASRQSAGSSNSTAAWHRSRQTPRWRRNASSAACTPSPVSAARVAAAAVE